MSKRFEPTAAVIESLTAEIPLTGVTYVVGKSGSGKSVLCRLAVGLLRPEAGEVWLLGQRVDQAPERLLIPMRRRVPYLVQGPALLDWLTVAENVALAARQGRAPGGPRSPEELGDRVQASLARVGMADLAGRYPSTLGPGARKRTAIARALALRPEYLLLDEPTTGLDRAATAQVNEVIASLRREGLGALVVSHDYRSLETLADRVLLVSKGGASYVEPSSVRELLEQ